MKPLLVWVALAASWAAGGTLKSYGTPKYQFEVDPVTVGATAGSPVHVDVYLVEQLQNGDVSRFQTENGLFLAGFRFDAVPDVPLATHPATVVGVAPNPGFTATFTSSTSPTGAQLWVAMDLTTTPMPTAGVLPVQDGADWRVWLGTVNLQLGSIPGEQTAFRVSDLTLDIDETSTFGTASAPGTILDAVLLPSNDAIVTVLVPEPATLTLLGAGVLALLRRRPRGT